MVRGIVVEQANRWNERDLLQAADEYQTLLASEGMAVLVAVHQEVGDCLSNSPMGWQK